jgi:hypothetical protein
MVEMLKDERVGERVIMPYMRGDCYWFKTYSNLVVFSVC